MKWASTVSREPRLEDGVQEAATVVRGLLCGEEPSLVVVFVSSDHGAQYHRVANLVRAKFGASKIIGCSAGGVIGGAREIEDEPAVSITAAVLPGVEVTGFHLRESAVPAATAGASPWEEMLGVSREQRPHFLLLPDPFSFDVESFVAGLDRVYPASGKIGGLASGARQAGGNALVLGCEVHRSGLVGVALSGDIEMDTIVAQGCRPIGQPMFITRARHNLLFELDGRPVGQVLRELYRALSSSDQELARQSLFLGIVMEKEQMEYRRGDFLIRNLMGMSPQAGALSIGAVLDEGSVVQFHVRDAKTSTEDLGAMLSGYQESRGSGAAEGALLFSCMGRGTHFYGKADHDSGKFRQCVGEIPLGGFFCNGEIGPVRGTTFLHGYTSAFGIFRSGGADR